MTNLEVVTMRRKELDRLVYLEKIKKKELTQVEASEILDLSLRQIKRLFKKYKRMGAAGLAHGNRGKTSGRATSPAIQGQMVQILRTKLQDFKPTFASEKLRELFGITISREALRKIMIKHDLWEPKKKRINKHVWRERKHHVGELLQLDGSKHLWFNNEYSTLIAVIDDATGRILAQFAPEETIESVSELTKAYIEKYGRPKEIYADRGKVFKVNMGQKKNITQYNRMLNELDTKLTFARSPQAKGRVERLFKTLQDRLFLELRYAGITTMAEANHFLIEYVDKFNKQFSVLPKQPIDIHRSIDGFNLNSIFCVKTTRILKEDYTITYKNRWFQLDKKQPVFVRRNQSITVAIHFDGTISLWLNKQRLQCKEIAKKLPAIQRKEDKIVKDKYHRPPSSHPWRNPGLRDTKGDVSTLHKR